MKEQVTVMVRATPEKSKNHGYLVCVAGINENNEFRRLYPFEFEYGEKSLPFKKRDLIEVELESPDNDKRRESRKVKTFTNLSCPVEIEELRDRILPLVSSVEILTEEDASLGIVKPILENIEVNVNSTEIRDAQTYFNITGGFLEEREKVKLPVEVRYIFKCKGEARCQGHKIILIDWELNELARNIMKKDKDKAIVESKIKAKFFDEMQKRDLYFFMGTHFRFHTWLIIGLFYPPKKLHRSLFDFEAPKN